MPSYRLNARGRRMWLVAVAVWAAAIGGAQLTGGATAQAFRALTLLVPPAALVMIVLAGGYDRGGNLRSGPPRDRG